MEEQELNQPREVENKDASRKSDRSRHNRNRHRGQNRPRRENAEGTQEKTERQNHKPGNSEKQQNQKKHEGVRKKDNNRPAPDNGGKEPKENKENKDHRENKEKDKKQNGRNKDNRDRKKQRQAHGGNVHTRRGLEDLYGSPTENDVMTAEEWRAKIVLKAADGSVPAEERIPAKAVPSEEPMQIPVTDSELLIPMPEDPAPAGEAEESVEVVGIRFRSAGKVYYFDPKGLRIRAGDAVIVETARGPEYGDTVFGNRNVNKKNTVSPLRPVLRIATPEDTARNAQNREKEKQALVICQQKIQDHKLEMKLIDVQYAFDNTKLLFYFTSDGRVDFRDLVKDLASVFRTRIELRQIGIRDEAKMLGGLGACGRPLCCASFLSDFVQVSIKMAKEQNLSLNSAKISGVCGRLMCCLRYESEVYAEEIRRTPSNGTTVKTADGIGTVIGSAPLAGTVKVQLKNDPDTPPKIYSRDEVTVLGREKAEPAGKEN